MVNSSINNMDSTNTLQRNSRVSQNFLSGIFFSIPLVNNLPHNRVHALPIGYFKYSNMFFPKNQHVAEKYFQSPPPTLSK